MFCVIADIERHYHWSTGRRPVHGVVADCVRRIMMGRSRQTKVLGILLVSMVTGAAILNAMSHTPLSASAFCLSQYNDLTSVEESLGGQAIQDPHRWERIEIRYGNHRDFQAGPSESGTKCEGANCHFIICGGYLGNHGQIQSTAKWLSQFVFGRNSEYRPGQIDDTGQIICICIATNDESTPPTDLQMRRAQALVEELCRRFRIDPQAVRYPNS